MSSAVETAVRRVSLGNGFRAVAVLPDVFVIEFDRPDTYTGQMATGCSAPKSVPDDWTESQIVRAIFGTYLGVVEHEAREAFKYRGKRIFGPHIDVAALAGVADLVDHEVPTSSVDLLVDDAGPTAEPEPVSHPLEGAPEVWDEQGDRWVRMQDGTYTCASIAARNGWTTEQLEQGASEFSLFARWTFGRLVGTYDLHVKDPVS